MRNMKTAGTAPGGDLIVASTNFRIAKYIDKMADVMIIIGKELLKTCIIFRKK